MKQRNVFYLVETIQPWVGVDRFEIEPHGVTTNHKLFRDENEAYDAFFLDCKLWSTWGAEACAVREFNTFHCSDRPDGLLQMRQFIITIDKKEYVGYTKIIKLKAK